MIVEIIVVLIVIGLVVYLLDLLPVAEPYKTIARVLILLVVILWLLSLIGVVPRTPLFFRHS